MPSPCPRGETRRITLNRAVICHVSALSRTRTAEAKTCRKTQYRSAIYKSVSRRTEIVSSAQLTYSDLLQAANLVVADGHNIPQNTNLWECCGPEHDLIRFQLHTPDQVPSWPSRRAGAV